MSDAELNLRENRRRNMVRLAILSSAISILAITVYTQLAVTTKNVYAFLIAGSFVLILLSSLIIIGRRRNDDVFNRIWDLLATIAITALLISAVQANTGAEIGTAILIIFLVIVTQTLPQRQVIWGATLGAVASLTCGLLSFFSPLPQTAGATADLIITWVARGSTLAFLSLAMIQYRRQSISTRLLFSFLGIVVLISMTFNIVTSTSTTNALSDQVGLQLYTLAESRASLLSDHITGQLDILQALALDETIRQSVRAANALKPSLDSLQKTDEQYRQMASNNPNDPQVLRYSTNSLSRDLLAFQELYPNHTETFITDKLGALISTTHITSDYYQADEGWWQATYHSGEGNMYIGLPEFDESTNEVSIILAVPVYDTRQGDLIGILRSTLSIQGILNLMEQPIGETGQTGILFPNNTFIDTQNREFRDILPEELATFQEASNKAYTTTIYQGDESILTLVPIKPLFGTSIVGELGWNILVSQHTQEALTTVHQQTRTTSFIATIMAGLAAMLSLAVSQGLARPIINLTSAASKISAGDLSARAQIESDDEIGQLANTFNTMTEQLEGSLINLEQRVAERTADLEESTLHLQKRAEQFQAIAQLARTISTIQNLDTLFNRIVQQVSKQFGFYHAGLFLIDESGKYAVLSAANSEGGQRMLARKHRLAVGQTGIVGYVTSSGNPRIALDTGTDAVYFNNPDMPNTRSEMALPLRIGNKIIGALDVQSTEPNAFSEDDIEVLSILADEISIAIENVRLLAESQRVLADAQSAYGEFTKDAWRQITGRRKSIGYETSGVSIRPLEKPVAGTEIRQISPTGKIVEKLAIPIKLRDEVIGVINISMPDNRPLDTDELDITQALAGRVGIAIESATLLEESRRRAARESTISAISAKVSATAEIERIMQVAVGELRQALGATEVTLRIATGEQRSD